MGPGASWASLLHSDLSSSAGPQEGGLLCPEAFSIKKRTQKALVLLTFTLFCIKF